MSIDWILLLLVRQGQVVYFTLEIATRQVATIPPRFLLMVGRLASLGLKMPQDAAVLAAVLPWQHNPQHLSIQSRYLRALSGLTWW
jgi:hypothetical protein